MRHGLRQPARGQERGGHGDQQPDPLLSSAEGPGMSPAHRGLAYVVFEDLQLADFGIFDIEL